MSYSAFDIAKHIIQQSKPEVGDTVSNLKLQKLLYYAQGFHLALYDRPLFNEDIYAWQYGPVVPDVYHEYKHLGAGPIFIDGELEPLNEQAAELIKEVYEVYGQFSALKLMDMTHSERPWNETEISTVIKPELLKEYFLPLANL